MSARFGRNKRRAAREALAATQVQLNETAQALRATQSKRATAEMQAERAEREAKDAKRDALQQKRYFDAIVSMVARESMLAGEPSVLHNAGTWDYLERGDRINMIPLEPMPSLERLMGQSIDSMTVTYEVLRLMQVSKVYDRLRGVIHAKIHLADHTVGYAISEKALRTMSANELYSYLLPEVSEKLGKLLSTDLKRNFK